MLASVLPVSRRGRNSPPFRPTPLLATTRERDGYDFMRGSAKLWFEAWGTGSKDRWTTRADNGKPPTPHELAAAEYIVFGIEHPNGHVTYKTRIGGLDL